MRDIVKSRIYKQIRSHSQKYFKKLKAHFKITSVYQLYNLEFDYENYNKDMALKDLKLIKKNQDQKVFSNVDKYYDGQISFISFLYSLFSLPFE